MLFSLRVAFKIFLQQQRHKGLLNESMAFEYSWRDKMATESIFMLKHSSFKMLKGYKSRKNSSCFPKCNLKWNITYSFHSRHLTIVISYETFNSSQTEYRRSSVMRFIFFVEFNRLYFVSLQFYEVLWSIIKTYLLY